MPAARQSRSLQLDFLRGLAVILVIGAHIHNIPPSTRRPLKEILELWQHLGWVGVDLFFVLSGFLVSGLIFKEYIRHGKVSLPRFFIRRALKIYPAFYVFLFLALPTIGWIPDKVTVPAFLSEALFVQNYSPWYLWGHTWSLAIEEHFYLLLGLLLFFLGKRGGPNPFHRLIKIVIATNVLIFLLRIWTLHAFGHAEPWKTYYCPTHLRLDELFFGVLLSYCYHFHGRALEQIVTRRLAAICVVELLLLLPCLVAGWLKVVETMWLYSLGLVMLYVGFGLIILSAMHWQPPRWSSLLYWAIATIGYYSYSIYLWHMAILYAILAVPGGFGFPFGFTIELLLYVGGSIAAGVLMSRLIEQPLLVVRDRFFPSLSSR